MNIVNEPLRWSELYGRSKAVEELSLRLVDENTDLRKENIRLKRESELDQRCGECKERKGYYLDAETIQNQQERIAELVAESNRINGENLVLRMVARDMYNGLESLTDHPSKRYEAYWERLLQARRQLESLGVGGLNG